ncbi:hypothetical protein CROQUDRAFT_107267 [Cronartium quercuum f. sp. fusiforme G11]|uniref:Uncharacterized protein n=1 Tax=Cronartium quercuum f. sp. fusiforme G11 TaxID=708437 RepID=A0A9P6NG44_9BASI|nr:hypothetical protein CROQUDRAFT_107267 [Cronartium quercuum f. sp. fusiforme G11]
MWVSKMYLMVTIALFTATCHLVKAVQWSWKEPVVQKVISGKKTGLVVKRIKQLKTKSRITLTNTKENGLSNVEYRIPEYVDVSSGNEALDSDVQRKIVWRYGSMSIGAQQTTVKSFRKGVQFWTYKPPPREEVEESIESIESS